MFRRRARRWWQCPEGVALVQLKPRKPLVTLLAAVLVVATAMTGAPALAAELTDIAGTKYADAVNKLAALKVLTGFPDGTFRPEVIVTRVQMAAILVRALGDGAAAVAAKGASTFTDVADAYWGSGYVNRAQARRLVTGFPDGTFRPDEVVTYEQAVTMIVRALGRDAEAIAGGAAWPAGHVTLAHRLNLTANTSFAPGRVGATRGDIALMTKVAVFDVKDPATGQTLAVSVHKVAAGDGSGTADGATWGPATSITLSGSPKPDPKVARLILAANGTDTGEIRATVRDAVGNIVRSGGCRVTIKRTDKGAGGVYATDGWTDVEAAPVDGVVRVNVKSTANVTEDQFRAEVRQGDGTLFAISATLKVAAWALGPPVGLDVSWDGRPEVGTLFTMWSRVIDVNGRPVTTDPARPVTVTAYGGANFDRAVQSWTVDTERGLAIFDIALPAAGPHKFQMTSAGLRSTTSMALTVTPSAATALRLRTDPPALAAEGGGMAKLTAEVVDANGNTISGRRVQIRLALSSGAELGRIVGTDRITPYPADGIAFVLGGGLTPTLIGYFVASGQPGAALVTASDAAVGGLAASSVSVGMVQTGEPAKLAVVSTDGPTAAGKAQTVVVEVQDTAGNRITGLNTELSGGGSHGVTVERAGSLTGPLGGAAAVASGGAGTPARWEAGQAQFAGAAWAAETVTYTATGSVLWNGKVYTLAGGTGTGSFTWGAAHAVRVAFAPEIIAGDGSATSTVTLTVVDAHGNIVVTAGGTATASISHGAERGVIVGAGADGTAAVPIVNGVGSLTVRANAVQASGYVSVKVMYQLPGAAQAQPFLGKLLGVRYAGDAEAPRALFLAHWTKRSENSYWIYVDFSEPVDRESATDLAYYKFNDLTHGVATFVEATLMETGDEVRLLLNGPFEEGDKLTVEAGIKDLNGNQMRSDKVYTK
jgi:hypothetical protein